MVDERSQYSIKPRRLGNTRLYAGYIGRDVYMMSEFGVRYQQLSTISGSYPELWVRVDKHFNLFRPAYLDSRSCRKQEIRLDTPKAHHASMGNRHPSECQNRHLIIHTRIEKQ